MTSINEWDSLEEEAKASGARKPRCGVAVLLEILGNDFGQGAVTSVQRTLDNVRLTSSSIHKALEARVTPSDLPSTYTLQRHRRGNCTCKETA